MNSRIDQCSRHRADAWFAVLRVLRRLQANARDADAWHALGSALLVLGHRAGACVAFSHALELDDTRTQSQRALGNLLFDSGQFDSALRCFAKVEQGGSR
jgi:cytochrome c-type biogenesis protein CcmH/NrfG